MKMPNHVSGFLLILFSDHISSLLNSSVTFGFVPGGGAKGNCFVVGDSALGTVLESKMELEIWSENLFRTSALHSV